MTTNSHGQWLDNILPRHARLTTAVVSIVESLLHENSIDYLAVVGRTKEKASALEKIRRKGYSDPAKLMTDLSGIRIVLYFESDVQKVGELISRAFEIDSANSLDKDTLLSTNKIGYRSVHYVCSLGNKRSEIEEYKAISGMKFEFQIRTVLQHAWAELAHDRKYKFSGTLPPELERKLNLYAGLLEIADKGFDETAKAIDSYAQQMQARTSHGDFDIEIDSISLAKYVEVWAAKEAIQLEGLSSDLNDVVRELKEFGIRRLNQLDAIVPANYAQIVKQRHYNATIMGTVRDWMLLNDWRKFKNTVSFNWLMDQGAILDSFMPPEEYQKFAEAFEWDDDSYYPDED